MAKKKRKFNGKSYSLAYQTTRKSFAKEYADAYRKRGYYVRIIPANGEYIVYRRVISSSTLKSRIAKKRK